MGPRVADILSRIYYAKKNIEQMGPRAAEILSIIKKM
jgi:hypothetical protein